MPQPPTYFLAFIQSHIRLQAPSEGWPSTASRPLLPTFLRISHLRWCTARYFPMTRTSIDYTWLIHDVTTSAVSFSPSHHFRLVAAALLHAQAFGWLPSGSNALPCLSHASLGAWSLFISRRRRRAHEASAAMRAALLQRPAGAGIVPHQPRVSATTGPPFHYEAIIARLILSGGRQVPPSAAISPRLLLLPMPGPYFRRRHNARQRIMAPP